MPKSRYKNTSLANLEYRLRKFKDILHEELFGIIKQKEDVIINYVQQQQLYRRGITGDGKKIWEKHPYSPRTIANKKKKGQVTTRVTLKDSGKFYGDFDVVITAEGFYVTSYTDYSIYLEQRYGNNIYRLTDENLKKLLNVHIKPELKRRLKRRLLNG